MALQERDIPLRLDVGIESGADPKTIVGLTKIENGDFVRRGEIRKRQGQARSTSAQAGYSQIFPYGAQLVAIGQGKALRTYNPSGDAWSAALTEPQLWMEHTLQSLAPVRATQGTRQIDVCRLGDWLYIATLDDANTSTAITGMNTRTGERVTSTVTESYFRIVKMSASTAYFYYATDESQAKRLTLSSSGTIGSLTTITTITNADVSLAAGIPNFRFFDATLVSNGGTDYVCCVWADVTEPAYKFAALPNGADAGAASGVLYTPTDFHLCGIWAKGAVGSQVAVIATVDKVAGPVYQVYVQDRTVQNGDAMARWSSGEIGSSTAPIALAGYAANHTGAGNAGTLYVTRVAGANDDRNTTEYDLLNDAGTYNTDSDKTRQFYRHALMAKPASDGLGGWLVVMALSVRQRSDHAMIATQGRSLIAGYVVYSGGLQSRLTLSGAAAMGDADHVSRIGTHEPVTGQFGELGVPRVIFPLRSRRTSGWGASSYFDTGLAEWSLLQLKRHTVSAREADGCLLFSGSLPRQWHGPSKTLIEQGFLMFPELAGASKVSDGGTGYLTIDGEYLYALTYEWDGDGRRHQSAPTPVFFAGPHPTSGYTQIEVVAPSLGATERSGVRLVAWRTVASGTLLRRVAIALNNPASDLITLTDIVTDAISQRNERLYTQDGTLEALPPVPSLQSIAYQRRDVVQAMESEHGRYSRTALVHEPFNHHNILDIPFPPGDTPVALLEQGDKLYQLRTGSIYATEGEGLTDVGGGAGYLAPWEVSPKIGCTDKRILAKIPQGTLLRARDALWLLSVSGQVQPAGDPVRYYTSTYTLTDAVVLSERSKVVFLTSDGPAIIYDWLRDKWSTWSGMQSVSGAALSDTLHRLDASGYVWKQDSGFDDNGTHVPLLIETSWLSPWGDIGYGRIREVALIGQNIQKATLGMQLAYDLEPAWHTAKTLDLDTLQKFDVSAYFGSGGSLETYEGHGLILRAAAPRQKCSAFRIRIVETASGGVADSAGFALSAMLLSVAYKGKAGRVGASRQIGY